MNSTTKLKNIKWRKIGAPTTWRPIPGDELIGFYAGRTKREGSFGQYEVAIVAVPYKGTFMISGTKLIQLFDSAQLSRGEAVRIVYLGLRDVSTTDEKREMKEFELYVGEFEAADDLPAEPEVPAS